ncbi:MAG: murein L,D-transpeptidase catalytic domain family protein [Bacteroidia bacterium]|nr:murein L,D-transpeptidase catalytic domain family protein [Bacteroidia bacterium]
MNVKFSLSAIFGIFSLVAFTFPDSGVVGGKKASENVASNANVNVCDNQVFEYFYTSSIKFKALSDSIYYQLFSESNRPSRKVFDMAMKGYAYYLSEGVLAKPDILSFIDYSLSAIVKRLWVVDLKKMKVLFHELVAHGRNSGQEYAKKFSNVSNSFQTSLGFYITGEIYSGKHDLSVKMIGLERKFNSKAMDRGIVIHGADYVSEDYIKKNNRLGRSLGCPAVSESVIKSLSHTIADGSCVFAYYPNKVYLKTSQVVKKDPLFAVSAN